MRSEISLTYLDLRNVCRETQIALSGQQRVRRLRTKKNELCQTPTTCSQPATNYLLPLLEEGRSGELLTLLSAPQTVDSHKALFGNYRHNSLLQHRPALGLVAASFSIDRAQ
jgi:hypothetical protein